ncbi:uncharacterized protein G2W53_043508 [Senna tora]|uniref:Uncharacterized protein n=1 Tax=Senna tora TaxID=362788 RepID=A0A834W0A4_9FABA|nr:uncharacterized protein G2W53_043508 [Senna tora]
MVEEPRKMQRRLAKTEVANINTAVLGPKQSKLHSPLVLLLLSNKYCVVPVS